MPRSFSAILFMRMRYLRYLSSMENLAGLQLLQRLRSHTIGYSLAKAMLPSMFDQVSSANFTTASSAYSAFL